MELGTWVLVGGAAILGLGLLIVLVRRVARFLLAAGAVAVALGVVLALWEQARATRRATEAVAVAAAGSAATTIILALVLLLLAMIVLAVAGAAGWYWWRQFRRGQRLEEAWMEAQIRAAISGQRLPTAGPFPRQPMPPFVPGAGNVIVFPSAHPGPAWEYRYPEGDVTPGPYPGYDPLLPPGDEEDEWL